MPCFFTEGKVCAEDSICSGPTTLLQLLFILVVAFSCTLPMALILTESLLTYYKYNKKKEHDR
jgi:hypothetical protein